MTKQFFDDIGQRASHLEDLLTLVKASLRAEWVALFRYAENSWRYLGAGHSQVDLGMVVPGDIVSPLGEVLYLGEVVPALFWPIGDEDIWMIVGPMMADGLGAVRSMPTVAERSALEAVERRLSEFLLGASGGGFVGAATAVDGAGGSRGILTFEGSGDQPGDLVVMSSNIEAMGLLGFQSGDIVGRRLGELIDLEHRGIGLGLLLEGLRAGVGASGVVVAKTAEGAPLDVLIEAVPVATRWWSFVLTEVKARSKLVEYLRRFRVLANEISDAVDMETVAERLLDVGDRLFEGRALFGLSFDDAAPVLEGGEQLVLRGRNKVRLGVLSFLPVGRQFDDVDRLIIGFLAEFLSAALSSNLSLRLEMGNRMEVLWRALTELHFKGWAHDLKNHIGPFDMTVARVDKLMLLFRANPSLGHETLQLERFLKYFKSWGLHLQRFVGEIDEMAFPSASEFVPFDLVELLREKLPQLEVQVDAKSDHRARIDMRIHSELLLPPVSGLPRTFDAIVDNIVINAAEAIGNARPARSGTVTVELSREVGVRETRSTEMLVIRIKDDGPGIPPSILSALRRDESTSSKASGKHGHGFLAAKRAAARIGGEMEVSSGEGSGTVVEVRLPTASWPEDVVSPSGSERILVVEDDQILRDQYLAWLAELGYRVTWATSADQAFEMLSPLSEDLPDLVLSDVEMPGEFDGLRLVETMSVLLPEIKTGIMTADLTVRGDILRKPFGRHELAVYVRRMATEGWGSIPKRM